LERKGSAILYGAGCNLVDKEKINLDLGQGFVEALKQQWERHLSRVSTLIGVGFLFNFLQH